MDRDAEFKNDIAYLLANQGEQSLVYSVNISLKYRYIYYETPKVACSTIKRFLIRNELREFEPATPPLTGSFEDFHNRAYSPLLNPRQLHPFSHCLRSRHFFKFCFVRNPYDRLLSAYLDKIVNNSIQSESLKKHMRLPENAPMNISFGRFVEAVCSQPIKNMDPHWKPQYYHNCVAQIDYDLIGRMENLERDLIKLCDNTGLSPSLLNKFAPHATNAKEKTNSYYTSFLKKLVYEKYEADFTRFGYGP